MQLLNVLKQETENGVICAWRWTLSSCKNFPLWWQNHSSTSAEENLETSSSTFSLGLEVTSSHPNAFGLLKKKTPSLWLELTTSYPNVFGFLEFFWGIFFTIFFSLFCFGFLINSLFLAPAIQTLSQREQLNCPRKTSPDTSMHFKLTSN